MGKPSFGVRIARVCREHPAAARRRARQDRGTVAPACRQGGEAAGQAGTAASCVTAPLHRHIAAPSRAHGCADGPGLRRANRPASPGVSGIGQQRKPFVAAAGEEQRCQLRAPSRDGVPDRAAARRIPACPPPRRTAPNRPVPCRWCRYSRRPRRARRRPWGARLPGGAARRGRRCRPMSPAAAAARHRVIATSTCCPCPLRFRACKRQQQGDRGVGSGEHIGDLQAGQAGHRQAVQPRQRARQRQRQRIVPGAAGAAARSGRRS